MLKRRHEEEIDPQGRYRPTVAARLMMISRRSFYNYVEQNRIHSEVVMYDGKPVHYVTGLEILRFNAGRFFTPVGNGSYT